MRGSSTLDVVYMDAPAYRGMYARRVCSRLAHWRRVMRAYEMNARRFDKVMRDLAK